MTKKNVGKKISECLDSVCVYTCEAWHQGHQNSVSEYPVRDNWRRLETITRCSGRNTRCGQRDLGLDSRCGTYYLSHLGKSFNLFVFHLSHLKTGKSYAASRAAVKIK